MHGPYGFSIPEICLVFYDFILFWNNCMKLFDGADSIYSLDRYYRQGPSYSETFLPKSQCSGL